MSTGPDHSAELMFVVTNTLTINGDVGPSVHPVREPTMDCFFVGTG
jgi:hypothetical protein